ncbi:MAG: type II secretion system F family protein [Acidimicrobiales bacterium]
MSPAMLIVLGVACVVAVTGAAATALGVMRWRMVAHDPTAYLTELDANDAWSSGSSQFEQELRSSVTMRMIAPFAARTVTKVRVLTPRGYIDQIHDRLVVAGLAGRVRAEEFVTLQLLALGTGLILGIGIDVLARPSAGIGIVMLVVLVAVGAIAPRAWLARTLRARQDAIRKDLPDILDLLAIAVEAGSGFEGAMAVVCDTFSTTLGMELARTLKEMELGLSRREALHNLKRRTDVPDLSAFILALVQADALGMPIGPVLRAQAAEMRNRRRQWAREKAAKLPVKMLFPMVLLIFPAIMIVVLGPAVGSMLKILRVFN